MTARMKAGGILKYGRKTYVMGILNVTPDSFYDGSVHNTRKEALDHAGEMIANGADIVDVGGESTRPGAEEVSVGEELARVKPVIEKLASEKTLVSIDTYKPEVASVACEFGARMINDINGLRTPGMAEVAVEYDVPVVIMHMQGTPRNMQDNPQYGDVVLDIKKFFMERAEYAVKSGIKKENIILDPGIGFGKTVEHNLRIIKRLHEFKKLGYPLLVGPSRKSFIGNILGLPAEERLEGTLAAVTACIAGGADIVRVHDVREAVRASRVADAIYRRK